MKRLCGVFLALAAAAGACGADKNAKAQGDPAATALLADARAARAIWKDFPGFTADLEINVNGEASKVGVSVDPKGEVTIKGPNNEPERWARRTLASLVGHRLDDGGPATACAFEDDNADHPLGRAVRVLDDEYHSSYRIRDRQVIVVNREATDIRFSITVTENVVNKDGKYLPTCFVVNTWNLTTTLLTGSETHHQTWKRVGPFDLPETLTVVTAKEGGQEARGLKLSNLQLAR